MRGDGIGLMMNGRLSSLLFRFLNEAFRFLLDLIDDLKDPCTHKAVKGIQYCIHSVHVMHSPEFFFFKQSVKLLPQWLILIDDLLYVVILAF